MPTKPAEASAPATSKKTFTNWAAFEKAKVVPIQIVCDILHGHPADEACKTRLPLTAENMIKHLQAQHGGGFQITLRKWDGKPWPGWKELSDAGIEVVGLQCQVCDRQVEVSVRDIMNHLRTHQGKFRGAYQNFRDVFLMQIQDTPVNPPEDDDESFYSEDTK